MAKQRLSWPSWRYGPDGAGQIFQREEDVPEGWVDDPAKVGVPKPENPPGAPRAVPTAPKPRETPIERPTSFVEAVESVPAEALGDDEPVEFTPSPQLLGEDDLPPEPKPAKKLGKR